MYLKFFHPVILNSLMPCPVLGDGNCLFRAVSKAIYGHQEEHFLLRLFPTLEILKHRNLYDPQTPDFHDYIKDFNAECTSTCSNILDQVSTPGAFTGLIHIYALSTVLKQPIESYYPPSSHLFRGIQCFNRIVYGRDVGPKAPVARIMWSKLCFDKKESHTPNHFVPLFKLTKDPSTTIPEEEEIQWAVNGIEDKSLIVSIPRIVSQVIIESDYEECLLPKDDYHDGVLSDTEESLITKGKSLASASCFGTPLFKSKYLDITEILGILKSPNEVHESIPNGKRIMFILYWMRRKIWREQLMGKLLNITMTVVHGIVMVKAFQLPITV